MKRKFIKGSMAICLSLMFLLPISGTSLAAAPSVGPGITDVWDLNTVPVIYDGVRYSVSDFLSIKDSLPVVVYYPDKSNGEKLLYAFSSIEAFTNRFSIKLEIPKSNSNTKVKQNIGLSLLDLETGWGYNWKNTYRGGNCLQVQVGVNINDLGTYGYDNCISSAEYPYYSGAPYSLMVLCGGKNYAQPFFIVQINSYYPTLPEFNDVASSLCWQ